MRWSWVNFQGSGVLLVWIRVGQGPTTLAVGAGGGYLDIFTLIYAFSSLSPSLRGGRVARWCWVNFQCQGVLLIWIRVGQGPTTLAVRAGCFVYHFSFLSPSLWETARYRLKCCLKGPLNPKQHTNQLLPLFGRRSDKD